MVTVINLLEDLKCYLQALELEIKRLKGSHSLLLSVNNAKGDELAMIAIKGLNAAYAKKAEIERRLHQYLLVLNQLKDLKLEENMDLAYMMFEFSWDKDGLGK